MPPPGGETHHIIFSHISLAKASRIAMAYVKVGGVEYSPRLRLKGEVGWIYGHQLLAQDWMFWSLGHFVGGGRESLLSG